MASSTLQASIRALEHAGELRIISTPLDIYLEIPQLAYIEAKKPHGGQALLFTSPMKEGVACAMPVLMNLFGSFKRLELLADSPSVIASRIKDLLHLSPPRGIIGIYEAWRRYGVLRFSPPKVQKTSRAQAVRYIGKEVNLSMLPILTTWEHDSAPFITMGQVYTQSLDGKRKNLGLYRLQVHSHNELGLHWQIHKDATHFFHEYKNAGVKMPVSIALGGDPLYTWCAQAPLPHGIYELLLYGLIKKRRPNVAKCLTNDIYVPEDVDIVIEGFVDCNYLKDEGPFGDHTGFYTPIEPYPVLKVSAITHNSNPIYPATIVGKPPLEDKYMGYLTERVFLPLLQTSAHGLLDYAMPENGVFHNLILAKLAPSYPGHAKQLMHAFWGIGQMSFVKHAIFLGEDAPALRDYEAVLRYVLDRFCVNGIMISEGVCDALDHASPCYAYGGKLGLDVAEATLAAPIRPISDEKLCKMLRACVDTWQDKQASSLQHSDHASAQSHSDISPHTQGIQAHHIALVRQYGQGARVHIAIIAIARNASDSLLAECAMFARLSEYLKIAIFVDAWNNDLNNPYMLVWRIVNNIDAKRDVRVLGEQVFIDARQKQESPLHPRTWPKETNCSPHIIEGLRKKGFVIDEDLLHHYHICHSPETRT